MDIKLSKIPVNLVSAPFKLRRPKPNLKKRKKKKKKREEGRIIRLVEGGKTPTPAYVLSREKVFPALCQSWRTMRQPAVRDGRGRVR